MKFNAAAAEQTLLELTGLPTVAGGEQRVIDHITRWAKRRRNVLLEADAWGNLTLRLQRKPAEIPGAGAVPGAGAGAVILVAHMDHPAFVVTAVDGRTLTAEFRGGVADEYFVGSNVRVWHEGRSSRHSSPGVVEALHPADPSAGRRFKTVIARFRQAPPAQPGDLMNWDLGQPLLRKNELHAPACDDLAAVAAALEVFDVYRQTKKPTTEVRLLLTRAEEIGFIGAIGACQAGTIPAGSRVIVLENSKSFADSPLGAGPIVRVGDRSSVFDPGLTDAVARVAAKLEKDEPDFRWQRKLMPGGTCEASAYQAFGYCSTCVCLPLGNYHNMDEAAGRIAPERISRADYQGLIRLLVALCEQPVDVSENSALRPQLEKLFAERCDVLSSASQPPR